MTLHTYIYYQSEAWTRVFNMEGYDKLKAYTNVNLAAIFTNDDAGWKVMAYVKNAMDRDSITRAPYSWAAFFPQRRPRLEGDGLRQERDGPGFHYRRLPQLRRHRSDNQRL